MLIKDIISKRIPCEVCGNRDVGTFRLRVINNVSTVQCLECEEEYFTPEVDTVIKRINDKRIRKE